jgi:NitT/TauT family transport system permease protein
MDGYRMMAVTWLVKGGKKNKFKPLLGAILFMLMWQISCILFPTPFIPSIKDVSISWVVLMRGEIIPSAIYSTLNVIAGVLISSVSMIALSSLYFVFPIVEEMLDYVVNACRSVSPLAIYPVFIIIFGLGRDAHIAIIIWATWAGILLSTIKAMKLVDEQITEAAQLDGANRFQLFTNIVFPVASPYILSAIRIAIGWAWLSLIASEMIGSSKGLGYMILNYGQAFLYAKMYATIFTISLLVYAMNIGFLAVSKLYIGDEQQ